MTSTILSDDAPACLLVLFGATGDLTQRPLLPSLYNLAAAHLLPDNFAILGFAAEDWTEDKFRDHVKDALLQFWGADAKPEVVGWLQERSFYESGDFTNQAAFGSLKTRIEGTEQARGTGGNRLFYLAVAPRFIAGIAQCLAAAQISCEDGGAWRRIVIEKPFGHDVASARAECGAGEGVEGGANLPDRPLCGKGDGAGFGSVPILKRDL